jgi:hypothetical protein
VKFAPWPGCRIDVAVPGKNRNRISKGRVSRAEGKVGQLSLIINRCCIFFLNIYSLGFRVSLKNVFGENLLSGSFCMTS